MNMGLFTPQPVGTPGLAAIVLGGLACCASLLATRIGAGAPGSGDKRSARSAAGIALQMLGFAITGFGPVRASLAATGLPALAEAAAVAGLLLLSVLMFRSAARTMGANWSLVARTRADHQLVTDGIFARLRHPIYSAMALFLLALAIALGHEANLLV